MPRPRTIAELHARYDSEERALVLATLEREGWRLRRAAAALGVAASTLQTMIARHGLDEVYTQHSPGAGRPKSG